MRRPAEILSAVALVGIVLAGPALAQDGRIIQGIGFGPRTIATPAAPQIERPVLSVRLDEASVMRLSEPAQTIVIGNPSIADAIVHDGRTVIVTGKSFGTTNLIALSRAGEIIMERQIHVGEATSSMVTVQRGPDLETFACAPTCRRATIIGDATQRFADTIAQTQARNGLAASQMGAR